MRLLDEPRVLDHEPDVFGDRDGPIRGDDGLADFGWDGRGEGRTGAAGTVGVLDSRDVLKKCQMETAIFSVKHNHAT